jgi:Zn-dependent protease with chaperone function
MDILKFIQNKKNCKYDEYSRYRKKYLIIIISSIIGLTVISITIIATFLNFQPLGINNDVTLIVEVGIGLIITLIVYGISRKSEMKIDEKITV